MRAEKGAAAVEMAVLLFAIFTVWTLVWPLALAFQEQLQLGRTAGATVRFASSTPETKRSDCDGAPLANDRRPSAAQVVREAECVHFGTGSVPAGFDVSVSPDPGSAEPGDRITVTVSNSISLGWLGSMWESLGLGSSTATLTATATGIEE